MTNTPIRLTARPTLAISAIFMRPLPKMMAFGGVATGIMKAHDADSVAKWSGGGSWNSISSLFVVKLVRHFNGYSIADEEASSVIAACPPRWGSSFTCFFGNDVTQTRKAVPLRS